MQRGHKTISLLYKLLIICSCYPLVLLSLSQLEYQQSEKVADAEKNDKVEASIVELMKSKASFLLKFAGCVSVKSRVEVILFL